MYRLREKPKKNAPDSATATQIGKKKNNSQEVNSAAAGHDLRDRETAFLEATLWYLRQKLEPPGAHVIC